MNRGSEWRIWDLHVHTPESIEQHYKCNSGEDIWEKYINALEQLPSDIKVLGINDYLFIDGYMKVLDYKNRGRLKNIDLILPVVEFRLAMFGGNERFKRINYHVIFSNELTPDQIEQQFINALTPHYILSADCRERWGGVITRENLEDLGHRIIASVPEDRRSQFPNPGKVGFDNLNLNVSDILSPLNNASQIFKGKYITAIGKTEWDAFRWNDNSIADKKNIINGVDLVFTAAENVEAFDRAKRRLSDDGVNDLLLDCSDAHCFSEEMNCKDRLGNCNTWIKADATFEGLKQILYEPDERIRVQVSKPDEKSIYQVIDTITLAEDGFWQGVIPLNPNLNAIIGGRSTGKSSLLKAIAAKHNNKGVNADDFIQQHLPKVSIRWQDGNDQFGREIEYFRQSYMHDIAFDSKETNRIIEDIIRHRNKTDRLARYYDYSTELSKTISVSVFSVFQINGEMISLKKSILEKGNKDGVIQQLNLLKTKAEELQKDTELTQEERLAFDAYVQQIDQKRKSINLAEKDLAIYERLLSTSPFDPMYEEKMQMGDLSFEMNNYNTKRSFNELKDRTSTEWTIIINQFRDSTGKEKDRLGSDITAIMNTDIYRKGVQAFKDNKELIDVQERIIEEENTLADIEALQDKFVKLRQKRDELIQEIIGNQCAFKTEADKISETLSISYDGLEIHVNVNFKQKEFKEFLESRLNQRSYGQQEYIRDLTNNYDENNESYCRDFLIKMISGEIQLKGGYDAQNVTMEFLSRNWFTLNYEIIYQDDSFKKMSEGKQAFVILKLLLDFSDKKCPILIDQPEDSLDNRAIYNELVTYIKKKKKERQIILVTHNSNVVVGADAENVIVANQNGTNSPNRDGSKFRYINGALENTKVREETDTTDILSSQGIREHICDILEGGREAFEKREKKYGFDR